jgi:hypothetical protein
LEGLRAALIDATDVWFDPLLTWRLILKVVVCGVDHSSFEMGESVAIQLSSIGSIRCNFLCV